MLNINISQEQKEKDVLNIINYYENLKRTKSNCCQMHALFQFARIMIVLRMKEYKRTKKMTMVVLTEDYNFLQKKNTGRQ